MINLSRIVVFILVIIVFGGAIFLLSWDIPAPLTKIEKVIPNDRFPN